MLFLEKQLSVFFSGFAYVLHEYCDSLQNIESILQTSIVWASAPAEDILHVC